MAKPKTAKRKPAHTTPSWLDSRAFPWLLAAVYLVILITLFSGFVFSDAMIFGSDTVQAHFYFKAFYNDALHQGNLPEWSPYLFGGMPYVDAFHSDIFYLPSLPFKYFMPIHRALGWVIILHLLLAGMGMYHAAHKGWGLARLPAAVGGLAYMLAPYLVSLVLPGHDGKIFVAAWFPIGFLLLKHIWDHARVRDIGLFALTVGLIILTPHVQMAYFSLWAYAAYSVYRIAGALRAREGIPWRPAVGSLLAVFVAVGISAIQFYPGYQYVKEHSPRSGEGRGIEFAASWSTHPEEIVGCAVPEFPGVTNLGSNTYWGRNKVADRSESGGLAALLLAVTALFISRLRDRWFFLGLGAFACLYGLGAHTPLFSLFYHVVPNVKFMRAPAMIMFLYTFAISLGGAAALDALIAPARKASDQAARTRPLWIAAVLLAGLTLLITLDRHGMIALYTGLFYDSIDATHQAILRTHLDTIVTGFWIATLTATAVWLLARILPGRHALWAFAGIAAILAFTVARFDRQFIRPVAYSDYFPEHPVVDFLKEQPPPFRVFDLCSYLPAGAVAPWMSRPGFMTNYLALHGIAEFTGYHGNQLASYNAFLGGESLARLTNQDARKALDLANVRYLLIHRRPESTNVLGDSTFKLVQDYSLLQVYENTQAIPAARLVSCWELRNPADSLCIALFRDGFDYTQCVLVDTPPGFASDSDTASAGTAEITAYDLETVEISVQATRRALLMLSDTNYPAWHAQVDGTPAEIINTNGAFRAVAVEPGTHTVRFEYHSSRLTAGIWITLLSVLVALIAVGTGWRRSSNNG